MHTVRVSAPGKVILHGEHSVVYGKTAIAVSLGLRTSIVIKETPSTLEPSIRIHLPSVNLEDTLSLPYIQKYLFDPPYTGDRSWLHPERLSHDAHLKNVDDFLHKTNKDFANLQSNQKNSLRGFLYAFAGIFGSASFPINSLDITMDSELTIGAGTGSSASFAVCLVGALVQLLKLKSGKVSEEFSFEDKRVISGWAYNCERIMHGSPSGIDNSTCTFGSMVSFRRGHDPQLLDLNVDLRILLVDSCVSRQTKVLSAKVRGLRERNEAAVDCVMDACDHITGRVTELLGKLSGTKEEESIKSIYEHLAELWEMNHCLLAALHVSHPALEDIRAAARESGLAAKLTGAGGGGYAIVLVPPFMPQTTIDDLRNRLTKRGYRVIDTLVGGPGVRLH